MATEQNVNWSAYRTVQGELPAPDKKFTFPPLQKRFHSSKDYIAKKNPEVNTSPASFS